MTTPTVTNETIAGVADLKAGYTLGNADVAILKALSAELLAVREAQSVVPEMTIEKAVDIVWNDPGIDIDSPGAVYLAGWNARHTAPPAPEVPDMVGLSVSVDVSTSDDNAGYRYFGRVTEVQQSANPKDKGGVVLLVQDDVESNFDDGIAPDGYKLMPLEMTDEIGEAIAMEANCCGGIALDIYNAALAAAPTPTKAVNDAPKK